MCSRSEANSFVVVLAVIVWKRDTWYGTPEKVAQFFPPLTSLEVNRQKVISVLEVVFCIPVVGVISVDTERFFQLFNFEMFEIVTVFSPTVLMGCG